MREVLYEESANPDNLKAQKIAYFIYTAFMWIMIILAVISFMIFFFTNIFGPLVFTVLSAILFAFIKSKIYYCVDCIFVSGSTRIVKVVNFKKRKKIIIFEANEVVQVGKMTSNSYEKLAKTPNIKKIYGTPNKYIDDGFYVHLVQNNQAYLVILQCKETYLQHLVAFTGRQVIERDYK
ncbi:MAG: hypothetical protein IKA61_07100 [Clostridia bacterium]|nr:hypothetical protein [Clostridia bacterium]